MSTKYYAGSDDGKSIAFRKDDESFSGVNFSIKYSHIIIVLILSAAAVGAHHYSDNYTVERPAAIQAEMVQDTQDEKVFEEPLEAYYPIDENGFVFSMSDQMLLSEEDVLELATDEYVGFQRLLRMSVNEIYARHGHIFIEGGINDTHYRQYDWYNATYKHKVEWEEFNDIEKANLRLLLSIEEYYGY